MKISKSKCILITIALTIVVVYIILLVNKKHNVKIGLCPSHNEGYNDISGKYALMRSFTTTNSPLELYIPSSGLSTVKNGIVNFTDKNTQNNYINRP